MRKAGAKDYKIYSQKILKVTRKEQIDDFYKDHTNSHKLSDEILNKKLFDYLIEFSSNKVTEKSSKELQKGNK